MSPRTMPQPVLPRGFRQLGAFEKGAGSSWQTLVAQVDEEIASPAPAALPAGSRCVLKRRWCAGIGEAEQLVRDVRPLSVLQHQNVVRYFGVVLSPGAADVLLVCEFCSRGSLLDLIYYQRRSAGQGGGAGPGVNSRNGGLLAPELSLEILVQISSGLTYLHEEMSLAHGNLTAGNVVLDGSGVVKLTDVGLEDALDNSDYTSSRDAREDAERRGARKGMAYWSPERSLANAANGGFLPSGPSAPADCWAMGCIASELVSGVFVQERLASSSSLSLAQEPKVVAAFLRAIPHAASSHQGGQAAAKGGDGETCAALRTAWVMVGLLERDPMRRLEAGRAAFLLENPTWVPAPEATTVGSSRCITGPVMVPALSIPPPSRRRRGDSGDGEASSVSHMLPGVDMLSAVRRAIDGPDWRVFKDGKLVPNESQWHHDDLTTARSRERRASSPHPRAIRTMHAAENDGRIPQAMDDGGDGIGSVVLVEQDTDGQTAPSAPLSVRQRERAERQQTRRGLADLYLQAKQKQFPGADDNRAKANAPSRDAAIHASSERRNANGVDAAAPPVPLSSLKEDKAKRRGHGDWKCDARAATASALPPALLSSLPDASKRPYDMQAQDVWHAWLKSLGADVPDSEGEEEEDTPSQSASSAHAWSEDEQDEDNEAVDVGEMGPQEVADADMQVKDFLSPRLLVPDSRGTTRGNGVGLTVAGGDDEQEDAAQGRRGWVGGRGQEEHEPAGSNADGMKGDAGNRERQTVGSSLPGRNEETAAVSKTENFLSQHLVSVKNVAGNTVHVIGAAAPASEEETDTHSAPGRPHSQSVGQFSASSPNPHPSPDDEEDGTSGAPEEGRGGIVAKGVGGAEVEIKAKLLTSRSVGGDGGSGAGTGDGREVYTAFVLSCEGAGVEWQVCRRYSEFSELHLKLMSSLPPAKGRASRARAALSSRMPKKVMFGSNLPHVVAERLEKLRSYVAALQRVLALQALTNAKDAEKACEAWVQFCAVPSTAFAAAALGRSGHGLAASVAGASSPPHPAAVNALNLWAASAKPPLRGVLRRGALPGERQEAAKNKKVVVEEGRRQVVWGTDGVLQLDANTFIFGTPERLPGEYMKAAKKGIKSHRRAVDPAGPFLVGWWEDEALSDPPAQTEADDRAHRSVSADAAPAVAQPASKLDASLASLPDSSPGKKSAAAQACMGDGEAPVLAVRGELLVRKQDGQGSRTLSLLRDLDHVSRGRGPDREHTHELRGKATETKEQLTQATPLTLVTTLAPTNSALPTSNLRTRSSSTTPTTPPSSHPWIFLHEKWPAGSSEQGREQKKDSIEQGRDQDKEATSALAPTGMHLVAGRDLGRATISSGGSGSSWMSMRMAGRFGPPLPPLPPASEAPGRPGDTPPAARAAGSWDHADIMSSRGDMSLRTSEENPHARSAAPAGVSVLTGNGAVEVGAVEMGAERTGQGRAGASNLEIAASNVASSSHDMHVSSSSHGASNLEIAASNVGRAKGAAQAPLLELDEDLVQMEESLRKAKQVFATSNDAAPLSLQLEHKLASETLLAKTPLRHSAGSDDFLGGSVNGFRDHAFGAEMGEEEEEAVGLSADDLAALRDLDVAAATARKHDLEARLSHITQMLALKPSENGCAAALDQDLTRERKREDERGRERKREEETASGRSRWTNASTLPKTLPSVSGSISDLSSSALPRPPREGGGAIHAHTPTPHTPPQPSRSREGGNVGKRWSAVKAPCDTGSGGGGVQKLSASMALELPSLPTDKGARVANVSADVSQVVGEVGGRLEQEQAKRDSKRDLSLAFSEGLSASFSSLNGDADLRELASNGPLLSPASSPRVTQHPIPPPPSQVEHQPAHVEDTDEHEHAAYEPEDASDEGTPGWGSEFEES